MDRARGRIFDLDLQWTPDQMPQTTRAEADVQQLPVDPNGPSIFTAVQEQLGLKLDSPPVPSDVLSDRSSGEAVRRG